MWWSARLTRAGETSRNSAGTSGLGLRGVPRRAGPRRDLRLPLLSRRAAVPEFLARTVRHGAPDRAGGAARGNSTILAVSLAGPGRPVCRRAARSSRPVRTLRRLDDQFQGVGAARRASVSG